MPVRSLFDGCSVGWESPEGRVGRETPSLSLPAYGYRDIAWVAFVTPLLRDDCEPCRNLRQFRIRVLSSRQLDAMNLLRYSYAVDPLQMKKPSQEIIPAAFYCTETGTEPVREWLKGLDPEDRRIIGTDIRTVEFGWPVGMPVCRPMGNGLFEVRSTITGKRGLPVFYSAFMKEPWFFSTVF